MPGAKTVFTSQKQPDAITACFSAYISLRLASFLKHDSY